jgi:glycerate 2-kinase
VDTSRFFTHSQQDARIARIMAAALEAVEPGRVVEEYLHGHPLQSGRRVFALGVGKAALPMVESLSRCTDLERALVITKHAPDPDSHRLKRKIHGIRIMEAGHPLPDSRSLTAGKEALAFAAALQAEDMLVCLISGGGSALMTAPCLPLDELQGLTSALLACGARIDEINTLRRHLDRVKGGGLVKATRASVLSLILSDVVGNPLEAIASGPTAPDPTTRAEAFTVLEKYGLPIANLRQSSRKFIFAPSPKLAEPFPRSIPQSLSAYPETLKPADPVFSRVQNVIVGDNALAVDAALRRAQSEGFHTTSFGSAWQGEAREVGKTLAENLRVATSTQEAPFCLVAGGETTVTLQGDGHGGRNQELALAAVTPLDGQQNAVLISLGTDGEDGPTDAAGAVVSGETLKRARAMDLDPAWHLARNDAYPFFEKLGDLLKTGPTGTNVNDLVFLIKS